MAGAPPHGAADLFEAGPEGVKRVPELAAQLARMQPFAIAGNVRALVRTDREVRAFVMHVDRMQKANAAPRPAVRWAASLRTAAARLPRRSAGVPRAVRRGASRSFLCRRRRRAITRSAEQACPPTGEVQEQKALEDALRESAAEVWRESERERDGESRERERARARGRGREIHVIYIYIYIYIYIFI